MKEIFSTSDAGTSGRRRNVKSDYSFDFLDIRGRQEDFLTFLDIRGRQEDFLTFLDIRGRQEDFLTLLDIRGRQEDFLTPDIYSILFVSQTGKINRFILVNCRSEAFVTDPSMTNQILSRYEMHSSRVTRIWWR